MTDDEIRKSDWYSFFAGVFDLAYAVDPDAPERIMNRMQRLTRTAILEVNDLPTEEVALPEWGGSVLVRPLNGAERGQLEAESVKMKAGDTSILPTLRARVSVWCCVNDDGTRMFTAKDIDALSAKHPEPLDRIFNTVKRLSGMDEKAEAKAAKNLKSGQSSDSGTSSPSPSEA